ncbi:type VI secretion system lipoprotein TssJ [Elioraea tepidiphila]|uniref:type VI secretion system lipoprotein TssJ n=1 Tax=Elioraea tepidiphila TaxID=457934 RepID=UPI0003681CA5|nr:type VI secretion system lipoprotein TssJ [Elioraea tepidiphila]
MTDRPRFLTGRRLLLASLGAGLVAGAGQPPPPVVDLTVQVGPNVNPGVDGRPLPVAVKLYLLTAAGKFQAADVFALIEREAATLGAELIASEQIVFEPGQTRQITREADGRTRFLGAAVLFRDIDRAQWKSIQPVASTGVTRLRLTADRLESALNPA